LEHGTLKLEAGFLFSSQLRIGLFNLSGVFRYKVAKEDSNVRSNKEGKEQGVGVPGYTKTIRRHFPNGTGYGEDVS
jgi:hypothetical protein